MYYYGFELEGFYYNTVDSIQIITVPPKDYPVDGFPGLVEIRTTGYKTLENAYAELLQGIWKYSNVSFNEYYHTFSTEEKRILRKRPSFKVEADIRSLYNKKPRALGNKTIASFQINISNLVAEGYTTKDGHPVHARFTALDVARIVYNLDKEFEDIINKCGRQIGEYAIKGDRLEYRSLPNKVVQTDISNIKDFLERIRKAVEDS